MSVAEDIARRLAVERALLAMSRDLVGKSFQPRDRRRTPFPRGASWRSSRRWGSPWRGQPGDLLCPACETRIGSARVPTIAVATEVDFEGREITRHVPIGSKLTLVRGYVNARGRHASGERWYVPGKRGSSPPPRVRLPAIVTCRCGQDIELVGPDDIAVYAAGDDAARREKLARDLEEEAEDQFIQQQVDLLRGK
jgi:hypothetical protein